MLELARENKQVRRRTFDPDQATVRDIEIDLSGDYLGRGEDWVKAPLTKNVPHEIRHGIFFGRSSGRW
jgi:hypothetical protein